MTFIAWDSVLPELLFLRLALAMGGHVTRVDLTRALTLLGERLSRKFGSVDSYIRRLKERGYIVAVDRGVYKITRKGVEELKAMLVAISSVEEVVLTLVLESTS